ncbi:AbrB family transcriptional regulator [Aminithiophilus ramosus]|uniref:AbrB family transcriptional regulator n=2 Tax=Synergistales TaxID=649776 RepID=A0A9Q7AFP3_9BACT|nr:AbrB family transcriptional regulator [Aminithiophilus ramosus]QTX33329.1 AbrB family transcriptional regulator [Aminithiophilus ramosus]QVL36923.1 AbrB family transcriptional regulator [Synergistota bacterium]
MNWLVNVVVVFLIALPGWALLAALKMPAAAMMGAMVASTLFAVVGLAPSGPPFGLDLALQVILGLFIGLRVTKEADRIVREMGLVSLLASAWWLSLPLGLGWILYRFFGMDLATALLGTVPGGLAEMSLMAFSFSADAAMVAIMQFCRLASAMATIPLVARRLSRSKGMGQEVAARQERRKRKKDLSLPALGATLLLATTGGLVGKGLHIPAGAFVGALAATGTASYLGFRLAAPPKIVRDLAQLGLGSIIGLSATAETMRLLGRIFLPTLAITAVMLLWGLALALMVRRLARWNLMTCLIATSPGGITQLAAISEDLGADPLRVSLLHLVRLFTIYLILPPLIVRLAG